jgi:hypothetical protein
MVAYKGFKSYQRAFLGFSISMTLSNQLGIADSLSKPLPAASKSMAERRLRQVLPDSFVSEKARDSKCVAVASKGESAWSESPYAVPTTGNVVGKECSLATTLPEYRSKYIASRRTVESTDSAPASISTRTESVPVPQREKNNFVARWSQGSNNEQASGTTLCNDFRSLRTEIVKRLNTLTIVRNKKFVTGEYDCQFRVQQSCRFLQKHGCCQSSHLLNHLLLVLVVLLTMETSTMSLTMMLVVVVLMVLLLLSDGPAERRRRSRGWHRSK